VPDWTVYVRSPDLTTGAQVDDFQSLELVDRFNDVESWSLDIGAGSAAAAGLMRDGAGIVVTLGGTVVLSGPVTRRERSWADAANRLLVSGRGDTVWLARRLAHPQPTTAAPPYSTQAYDVRTGTCSTVLRQYVDFNAAGSALAVRQVPGLTLAADPGLGTSITGRARWQSLLQLLQELALAGGALGFQVNQVGSGIQFSVFQPTDRTASVVFSPDLANLSAFDWSEEAPASNYIVVGGSGTDVSRAIYESQDAVAVARWGRVEAFRDRRDTNVTTELAQAASDQLQQDAGPTSLAMTPIDLRQMAYLTHYFLGDQVTVVMDGQPVRQLIREVHVKLTPEAGAVVTPTIGTPGRQDLLGFFDRLRAAERRLTNLEKV
jgi:hypothetical protein